jgi:hypothetical protein
VRPVVVSHSFSWKLFDLSTSVWCCRLMLNKEEPEPEPEQVEHARFDCAIAYGVEFVWEKFEQHGEIKTGIHLA